MPEFRFTAHSTQENADIADGRLVGHLDIFGSAGQITTRRAKYPDGGPGLYVFLSMLQLLDGIYLLMDRGHGTFRYDYETTAKFKAKKDGMLTISHRGRAIDVAPVRDVAEALLAAGKDLADRHLADITRPTDIVDKTADGSPGYRDYGTITPKALAGFEERMKRLT